MGVAMCGMLVAGDLADFATALKDFKEGITSLNVTEIDHALETLKDGIDGIPNTEKQCKAVAADLKTIIASMKQIKGPKDLVMQIVKHLFDDADKIFAELAAAERAYKTGWDFMTAGQQLGMSVRRMLIGEGGDSPTPTPPAPGAKKAIVEGIALGFISDNLDFLKCGEDLLSEGGDIDRALKDFEQGIRHFNATEIKEAVEQIEVAIKGAASTKATCKAASAEIKIDIKAIISALMKIHGPKDFVIHIVDNLFTDGAKIFGELAAAGKNYKATQYLSSGRELGMAFRRMVVGEAVPDLVV